MAKTLSLLVTLLVLLTLSVGASSAQVLEIECVQQGLLDAGFDPNGVDGSLGNGTKSAAIAFNRTQQHALPDLTAETAGHWCARFRATEILSHSLEICRQHGTTPAGTFAVVGEWFKQHDSMEPVLPFVLFVEEIDGQGFSGRYAQGPYPDWQQPEVCAVISGRIESDGAIKHAANFSGARVLYTYPSMGRAVLSGMEHYLPDGGDWASRYGNTHSWLFLLDR